MSVTRHCRVKIVATIGPASSSPEVLERMVKAGMDVARINCSHASHESLAAQIELVRGVSRKLSYPLAVILDLGGPKLRTGRLQGGGPVRLVEGALIRIGAQVAEGDAERVGCTYAGLARDVQPGDAVLIDDGLIELEVVGTADEDVLCKVVTGGLLKERKGLNLPRTELAMPALTDKDRADLRVGVGLGVDYVALSFVQRADDVEELRAELQKLGADTPIIAKLERPKAIDNLESILEASDGVMVARGDLGVEAGSHRVPMLQKRILAEAGRRAVVDITATQMLESMTENVRPTRAEASDVANAILDGTDALMLSGETAVGKHPVETVAMMNSIALDVEEQIKYLPAPETADASLGEAPGWEVAQAACQIARHDRFRAIVVLTESGWTARAVSAFGPRAAILALTPLEKTWRRLTLVRGVYPVLLPFVGGADQIFAAGEAELKRRELLRPGDEAILVSGQLDSWGVTHVLKLLRIRGEEGSGPTMQPQVAFTSMNRIVSLDE